LSGRPLRAGARKRNRQRAFYHSRRDRRQQINFATKLCARHDASDASEEAMTTTQASTSSTAITVTGKRDRVEETDVSDSAVTITGKRDDVSLADVSDR
jgi:hypothetical protein